LPGDELLKINGKNAYSLDLEEIRDILAGKKGSRIKLVFLRNEEEIKKEFYLRDRFEDLMNNSKN
jgi:C-terminal processing protease CtpA/Prc